jgi:histidinol-phosphate aminotransferase
MAGYVPGEQPQGGQFIKLNTNENPYPPSPAVVEAIQDVLVSGLARYPDPMAETFRTRAADVLGVPPDWILCGNGSDEILTIVTRAIVGEGEKLRAPFPSYLLYRTLAEIQGAQLDEVPFCSDWSIVPQFALNTHGVKLAVLANPNSPSGTLVPRGEILELADALPCPLLVDEAYVDFAEENCLDLVGQNERIMVSRSLSKSYALAGLRFGYLVAQPHLVEQFAKVKDSYNCSALAIAGATAAIEDQSWLAENRRRIVATRQRLAASLQQLGFSIPPSQANFLWCTHDGQPAKPIYEELKSQRVLVRYMNYPDWGDGLRVSVGSDDQIDVLLSLIPRAMS